MSVPEFPALRPNGYRDTWCGQVLPDRVGGEVRVAGWVHRRRDHGGLIFVDLRDRTGIVQLVFDPDESAEAKELAHKLRAEDVLSAAGEVVRRDPETVNASIPTGEVELRVTDLGPDRRRGHAAVRDRGLLGRGRRGDAPAPPLPRPAPRADAARDRAARPRRERDARVPRRRGLPRDRDPGAHPLDARGRARLPRARAATRPVPSTRCRSRRSSSSSS